MTDYNIAPYRTEEYQQKLRQQEALLPKGDAFHPCYIEDDYSFVRDSLIYRERDSVWDIAAFRSPDRRPVEVFQLNDSEQRGLMHPARANCRDMLIKFPRTDVRLPEVFVGVRSLVKKIINIDASLFQRFYGDYAYLTFEQSVVTPGEIQRFKGCHVDGFQGPRLRKKLPIDRSYVISSSASARHYPQVFDTSGLDDTRDDFNVFFTKKADMRRAFIARDMAAYLINAYCVHEALPAQEEGLRSFMRLTFSRRQNNRLGNTVNPLFDYNWDYQLRGQRQKLYEEDVENH